MKVIYYTNGNIKPEENTKHVINFFGVLGCIKVNARDKNPHKKQGRKLSITLTIPIFLELLIQNPFKKN